MGTRARDAKNNFRKGLESAQISHSALMKKLSAVIELSGKENLFWCRHGNETKILLSLNLSKQMKKVKKKREFQKSAIKMTLQ